MMAHEKYVHLLVLYLTTVSAFSIDYRNENRGRKTFGGYRIEPKVCQPMNPSTIKSSEPPICMFNHDCKLRNGEVVGHCVDSFMIGACCQLPSKGSSSTPAVNLHSNGPTFEEIEGIDHAPELPILLKPDGTPFGTTLDDLSTKSSTPSGSSLQAQVTELQNKFPALLGQQSILDDLSLPGLLMNSGNNDIRDHQDPAAMKPITTLLSPDQVLQIADPVDQLPALFSQGMGQSNHSGADTILLDNNGTLMDQGNYRPDQLFVPMNRSTLSPTTFVTERTQSSSTKSQEPMKYMNTQRFSSTTQKTSGLVRIPTITSESQTGNKKHDDTLDREEIAINHIISILNGSNQSAPVTQKVQSTDGSSSIHSWVTIDDTSVPSTSSESFSYTYYKPTSKPTNYYHYDTGSSTTMMKKASTKPPGFSTGASSYGTSSSGFSYSTRPTTNPPAPTVIVLGPLGTEYTTVTSPKPNTRRPSSPSTSIRPTSVTKKPNIGTTITHNISTVISTGTAPGSSSTGNVISTSYINVNMKDKPASEPEKAEIITKRPSTVWTTISTWSSKPSFQLKPANKPDFVWPEDNLTPVQTIILKPTKKPIASSTLTTASCDDETAPPDDQSAFPPDRNPNLNVTPSSQQEKPSIVGLNGTGYPDIAIVSENEIPAPGFIEDDILKNKVDDFVHKIVGSLQGDFQNLQDVVYTRENVTTTSSTFAPTKKPPTTTTTTTTGATRKPTTRPGQVVTKKPTTKRPASTNKPASGKPTKVKPSTKPGVTGSTTKRPSSSIGTKRPKPPKKPTTLASTSVTTTEAPSTSEIHNIVTQLNMGIVPEEPSTTPDYRRECGVRPLIKKGRIVGGKGATFGEWPWQVLVREATWLGLFTKNKCGGVLITDKYVITAAHCQPGFLASLVAVFGEFDISGELESRRSVTRNVKRVIVNRAYDPATFANDLALLELETPIQFDAHIVPICMPDDDADFTGQMATVTGWGRVKYNGGVPSVLQEVQVPIMENSVCQEMFKTAEHTKLIIDSFLCAGYASGLKDSCEGDSGGPLMIERPDGRWVLVGTVSHGIKCAAPYLPGVYMRTTFFKPWLHSVTGV